jgi:hypothetical protein
VLRSYDTGAMSDSSEALLLTIFIACHEDVRFPAKICNSNSNIIISKTPPKKKAKTDEKLVQNFIWTDDEVSLLLNIVHEYKANQIHAGFDWEPLKTKYVDITEMFVKRYPTTSTGVVDREHFPKFDPGKQFTKERVVSKIKAIRVKYKASLDSGRRSGGGRVVATFFDICSSIWAGSPSAQCIDSGVESFNIGSVEKDTEEKGEEIAESTTVQSDHEENCCTLVPDCDILDHDVDESSTQIELCENSISQTNVSQTNVTQTSGRRDLIAYIQDQWNGKMKRSTTQTRNIEAPKRNRF